MYTRYGKVVQQIVPPAVHLSHTFVIVSLVCIVTRRKHCIYVCARRSKSLAVLRRICTPATYGNTTFDYTPEYVHGRSVRRTVAATQGW